MADTKVIDEFAAKNNLPQVAPGEANRVLLEAFLGFLKERAQYVEPGDLKKQFIEVETVRDRNKVPVEVATCNVCGHQEFEVKQD